MQINKSVVAERFRRNMKSYEENARIQRFVAERLDMEALSLVGEIPGRTLEIGCGTGLLTRELLKWIPAEDLYLNDLVGEMCTYTAEETGVPAKNVLVGDIERIDLTVPFGLVVSSSVFQWLENPGVVLEKLADHLEDGGFLIFSSFGSENLREVRCATAGKGLEYQDMEGWKSMLGLRFRVLDSFSFIETCYFDSPIEVLRHLKMTGANGTADSRAWTRGDLDRFSQNYARFQSERGYSLTYHPILFTCRKL